MTLAPIATVRSCFGGKFGVPRQPGLCPSAWGRLEFHPPYRSPEAVRGIEGFSHLWLIFGFHATVAQGWKPTVRPPLYATTLRSPYGHARIVGIDTAAAEGPVLLLGGLDLLDGTPVYDVKPYLPYAEAPAAATGGFAGEEIPRLPVEIAPEAAVGFANLPPRAQALVREALALDPRPATQAGDPSRVFGALLCGHNVRFTIRDGVCRICGVEHLGNPK